MTPRLLTIQEVNERTGLSVHTLYKMVSQRRVPHVKLGSALRLDPEKLDQWIEQNNVVLRFATSNLIGLRNGATWPN